MGLGTRRGDMGITCLVSRRSLHWERSRNLSPRDPPWSYVRALGGPPYIRTFESAAMIRSLLLTLSAIQDFVPAVHYSYPIFDL